MVRAVDITGKVKYNNGMEMQPRLSREIQGRGEAMAETNLAEVIEATNERSVYDTNVKFLLADKQILARILKYAVREFQDMTLEDIMASIGADIEVGTRPVAPGLSNMGRVKEANIEDNIPGEGKIFYDIRFPAYHKMTEIKFLINIEAQKTSNPGKLGYHLENRIVFYLARMISAQKQTEFYHSNYDDLKPVRSIWICMSGSEDGDSIEEIYLDRKMVFGNKVNSCGVDLMKGIVVNIRGGNAIKSSQNLLISMLEKLLTQMDVNEKKRILVTEYGMIMTVELERMLQTMCNLSENIEARGIEQGIKQGIKQERLEAIERMVKAGAGKRQILLYGYTEEEFAETQRALCAEA